MSKVIRTRTADTLTSLLSELEHLSKNELHREDNECVYTIGRNGSPLRVTLLEDTLTDGSKVFNICID